MKRIITFIGLLVAGTVFSQVPPNAIWVDSNATSSGNGSKSSPYRSITKAFKKVRPGSTVVIRKGLYRELLNLPGGQKDHPVTIMGMPGERVVISGMKKLSGWKSVGRGIYMTTIGWNPDKLFINFSELPEARLPREGWWDIHKKEEEVFQSDKIKAVPKKLDGVKCYIWEKRGNRFYTVDITSIDRKKGIAEFRKPNKWFRLSEGDKIYFKSHPSLIAKAGDWATRKVKGRFELYYKPASSADLSKVEASWTTRNLVNIADKTDIKLSGLEVYGGMNNGIYASRAERIEVSNCLVHDNTRGGIIVHTGKDCIIRNNLVAKNYTGVSVVKSTDSQVYENEICFNYMDGLLVTWQSRNISVSRNFCHDHLLWGHPDNMQMYRDLKNIRIEDNLFLAGGQSLMVEEADEIHLKGNVFAGSLANQVLLGHKNTTNVKILNNTFAFSGYFPITFTASNYEVFDNVMMLGHSGTFFGYTTASSLCGGRNLFFAAENCAGGINFNRYYRTFREFKQANPNQEKGSVYADPEFINAPKYMYVIDKKRITQCTHSKFFMRSGIDSYVPGDNVEVNFDGIQRRIVKTGPGYIELSPSLERLPIKGWMIANWKTNRDFRLDLRLKSSSAGAKIANGKPAGSQINIQAYRRGDFNGDGKRDIPVLPNDVVMPKY